MSGLDIAATGMQAQQLMIDVISNNLANMNTTAFKRQRPAFKDLLYINRSMAGVNATIEGNLIPRGIQLGLGVRLGEVYRIHEQGSLSETRHKLDLAIKGDGYFRIDLNNGQIAYTRDGSFTRNANGDIVNSEGYLLAPGITIPENAIKTSINESGEVEVTIPGQMEPVLLGQIDLARFINEEGLEAVGNNLFMESVSSGPPTVDLPGNNGLGKIIQTFVESSNVDPIVCMTDLIKANRAYEMNAKAMQIHSDVWKVVNNIQD